METPDGVRRAVIGDVSGHGPDEAALGVSLRIAWRTLVLAGLPAHRVLPVLDEVLVRERRSDEVFATVAMLGVADDRRSALLHLAGHPPPLALAPTVGPLPDTALGPPLGVLAELTWPGHPVDLGEQWSLLLYTDGLIEGYADRAPDRLGADGLAALTRELVADGRSSDGLLAALLDRVVDLNGDDLTDDVAMVLLSSRQSGR